MEEGALAVERRIAARDTGLQGPITVTSLAWFGDVHAPLVARFSGRHKLVTIELVSDPRRFNLSRREAGVALRIGSFYQEYPVDRRVGDVSYGLYASADYLDRSRSQLCQGLRRSPHHYSSRGAGQGRSHRMAEGYRAAGACDPSPEPSNTVKLGVHPDMRDTPRIRALIDFLVAEPKARSRKLNPSKAGSAPRR
jgi:DNA-binding transcriptional LysR family regulator